MDDDKYFRTIVENISDVIWVFDIRNPSRLIYVSPSVSNLLGYSVEEAMSKNMKEVYSAKSLQISQRALVDEMWTRSIGGKLSKSRILELDLLHKDGSVITTEVKFTFLPHSKNDFTVLAVLRDVGERKKTEQEIKLGTDKLLKAMEDMLQALARVVEMRDPYTAGHERRATDLACLIAVNMGLSSDQITGLRLAGLIHDLGKVRVPAEILTNPNELSEAEYAIIRTHPLLGYEILKNIELPWPVAKIVYQHHERIDGSGYPQGICGENILLEARILAVADVVEAIASHRPYREALGIDQALEEITKNKGQLYDPQIVDCCLVLFRERLFSFR